MPIQKGPTQASHPALKSIQKVPPRPMAGPPIQPQPGMNPLRAARREVRREAVRNAVNQIQPLRPRPVVRPAAPPQKVMPKTPTPPPAQLKTMNKFARPNPAPAARASSVPAAIGVGAVAAGLLALNVSSAHADLASEASSLQSSLNDLQNRSTFGDVQSAVTNLDSLLNRVSQLLESARQEGYRYQSDLEDSVYSAMSQWEALRNQVLANMQQQATAMHSRLVTLNPQIQRLNAVLGNAGAAATLLRSTQSQINDLLFDVNRIESDLNGSYAQIETQAQQANGRLNNIHWAMDQLSAARFKLNSGEDLVMAVGARWDKEGKDDPEGVLYLSNRRLIFERKEKVATKKILFITTASELVQEVLIDQALSGIDQLKAENKGLFGHQDFLKVVFKDGKLGEVDFHLNGQDSDDWASMVERSQSGQIEAERAGGGSGLSASQLSRPITKADILAVQSEINELQDDVMLQQARGELSDLENEVRSLERKLAAVRSGGYAIEKGLEADLTILASQWDRIKGNAEKTIETQSRLLGDQMSSLQKELARLVGLADNLTAARPLFMQVKSSAASIEAQADAAQDTVLAQYDEYADEVESLSAHLDWVDWTLSALSTASFRLLATESGVAAVEAVFQHPNWEPENGILFLTDQRLLWEDRVDAYELKVDVPLQEILDVKKESAEDSDHDILVFQLGSGGPVPDARFQLSMPVADDWLKMVGRARSGGYAQDRAVEISPEELERIRNAPQQCSNCGAAFTTPILRGQTEIHCTYCGVTTRI